MAYVDFVGAIHTATKRDYVQRVVEYDKAECADVAGRFGQDYWDGERKYGYGGYRYDGRWRKVADLFVAHYGLKPGMRVLDVGCGKGFLLHDLTQAVPGLEVAGIDVSAYGIEHAKEEVRPFLRVGCATELPWPDRHFDFVYSINTLHNLKAPALAAAAAEIERVGIGAKHITVEGYRTEREKANLLYWQLTCRAFHTPDEWQWVLGRAGYTGDLGCIFFE
jgi:SAM-dependent methyltransferase